MNRRTLILGALAAPFAMLRGRAPREPKQPLHALMISEQRGGVINGGGVMSDTFLISEHGRPASQFKFNARTNRATLKAGVRRK